MGFNYETAAAVSAYQTIVQDDKTIKIKVKNKKGEYEYTAAFDGSECKYVDNDKGNIKYILFIFVICTVIRIFRYNNI